MRSKDNLLSFNHPITGEIIGEELMSQRSLNGLRKLIGKLLQCPQANSKWATANSQTASAKGGPRKRPKTTTCNAS